MDSRRRGSAGPAPIDADFKLPEPYQHHAAFPVDPDNERDRIIASVGPLIVRESQRFLRQLRPHERIQLELTDLIQEAWAVILHKIRLYDPDRAALTTFCGLVIVQRFKELRNQARAVRVPRRGYAKLAAAGEYSEADLMPIRRAMKPVKRIEGHHLQSDSPEASELAARSESAHLAREAVDEVVSRLPRRAAAILRRYHGLGGRPAESPARIGRRFGLSSAGITGVRLKGKAAIRSAAGNPKLSRALDCCGIR
jgi:RNA polymerase sigma factor (sigma-70 family)